MDAGLLWLQSHQNTDGCWNNNTKFTILDTSTVLDSLKLLNANSPAYSNGTVWLSLQSSGLTDFLSRKVISLYMAGVDTSPDLTALLNNRNSDGGWGGDEESTSVVIDTALALQALKSVNYPDLNTIGYALGYLLYAQNADGGWGFCPAASLVCGDGEADSNVYMTAIVLSTLQQFSQTTAMATAINKATVYLLARQNPDGSFGESPSAVYETALAFLALKGITTDATVLGSAVNYLKATQSEDGSWLDDPYSTALALRALYLAEDIPPVEPPIISNPQCLAPSASGTTISGKAIDAETGLPIANAEIKVMGTVLTAKTDALGTYILTGINLLEFVLETSASGYDSKIYHIKTTTYCTYEVDFSLNPAILGGLKITSLATGIGSYSAYEDVLITAYIENIGTISQDALIVAEIVNSAGEVIAFVSPNEPVITILPLSQSVVAMTWNTGQFAPGDYMVILKAAEPSTTGMDSFAGAVISKKAATFSIIPSYSIAGAIAFNPPATQVDMQIPVAITSAVRNTGNTPLSTTLKLEVFLNETIVYMSIYAVVDLKVNNVLNLDFGSFIPLEDGTYSITLKPADQTIASNISRTLYVGPHAKATFTVTPDKVLYGDVKIKGNIHFEGIDAVASHTIDPLLFLVKDAIQRGVDYEQVEAMRWHNISNCNGCHIQSMTVVGLERSRDKVTVDESVAKTLFDALREWQGEDGMLRGNHDDWFYSGYTQTHIALWAFLAWHDRHEAMPNILKAADYLLTKQSPYGSWGCGLKWFDSSDVCSAMITAEIAEVYNISGEQKYLDAVTKASGQLISAVKSIQAGDSFRIAAIVMGLNAVVDMLQEESLKASANEAIYYGVKELKLGQKSDGGWSQSGSYQSDSLVTAQAIYTLLKTGVPSDDIVIKRAIEFLLNNQDADGSWSSQNNIFSTRLAVTTWVIMSLPIAHEKLNGIDVETHLELSDNVTLDSTDPLPVSPNMTEYIWKSEGVNGTGKDINMDLTVSGLASGETRRVAKNAFMRVKATDIVELIANDDFSEDSHLWTIKSGTWALENGEYSGSASGYSTASSYIDNVSWQDYRADIKVNNYKYGSAHIMVRSDGTNGYGISASSNSMSIYKYVNGKRTDIKSFQISIPINTWHTLGIECKGNAIDFYFNGTLKHSILDTSLTSGGVKLSLYGGAASSHAHFDDLVITSVTERFIDIPITIPSVTRISPVSIEVSTDKLQYKANEDVNIKLNINNIGTEIKDSTVNIAIEDQSGNIVAQVAAFKLNEVKPPGSSDWAYRVSANIPMKNDIRNATAEIEINFSEIFEKLGISDKHMDKNSIRVLQVDGAGNLIAEKQASVVFKTDYIATVTWLIDSLIEKDSIGYFYVYFDIAENGSKEVSDNMRIPVTGRLIAFSDDAGKVYTIESNGDGTFGTPVMVDDVTISNTDYSRGILLDDFNNDGFVDIVTGSGANRTIYYYQNNADSTNTFRPKVAIGTIEKTDYTHLIMDAAASDFNNDGNKDFVISGLFSPMYLFEGNGDGTFVQSELPSPDGILRFRGKSAADVNGDGNADLVVSEYFGKIYLYIGKGDATFEQPVFVGGVSRYDPYGLVTGDFDGDKKIDILVGDKTKGFAYIFRGNGDGTFKSARYISSLPVSNSTSFDTGDFNNDGFLDVIAATYSNKTIDFYPGKEYAEFDAVRTIFITDSNTLGISSSPALPEFHPQVGFPELMPMKVYNFVWNTGNTYPGEYKVHAILVEGSTAIAEDYASFTILPDARIDSKVVTDKVAYNANETVTITSHVSNSSSNYVLRSLKTAITIKDSSGTEHYNKTDILSILALGQQIELKDYWNTASNHSGIYTIRLNIYDAEALLSTSSINFEIRGSAQTGTGLTGTITTDLNPIDQGDNETFRYSVFNQGNEDIAGLDVKVMIIDPDTQEIKQVFDDPADIPMNMAKTGVIITPTATLVPKTYLAILQVLSAAMAEPKTLTSTTFTVRDITPPQVSIISPILGSYHKSPIDISVIATDYGSGVERVEYRVDIKEWKLLPVSDPLSSRYSAIWSPMIADEGTHTISFRAYDKAGNESSIISVTVTIEVIVGTVSAQPNPIYQGKDETLSYSITNSAGEDIVDLNIKVEIIGPDTQETKQIFDAISSVPMNSIITGNFTSSTSTLTPKTYLVVLKVSSASMAEPKTLASTNFEVKPGLEVSKTIPDISRVLVWLNYPWQSGQHCPDSEVIERALSEAGVTYYIVLDKKDFQTELSNPFYTDFLILGDHHPLEDHYADELMRLVNEGKGLVSSLFNGLNLNETVFGIKFIGSLPSSDYPVELMESEISHGGLFQSHGKALKILVENQEIDPTERTMGWVKEETRKGTVYYPAIVKNKYGEGDVLYLVFDLGMSSDDYEHFASLLRNSLYFVHMPIDPDNIKPNQMVPVEIIIKSLGGDFDIHAKETVSQGLSVYDPLSGQWVTDNPWTYEFPLEANQTKEMLYYVLTPYNSSTYILDTEIGYLEEGVYTFYQNLILTLNVW
jgi:prenyltransferase beta subunit